MAQLKDLIVNGSSRLIGDVFASGGATSPTPAAGTNDTTVATTAFVLTAINNALTSSGNAAVGDVLAGKTFSSSAGIGKTGTMPTVTTTVSGGGLTQSGNSGGGLSGGGLSVTANYSGTPVVTLSSGSETNMSNITIGSKDTTNYPYYFKVNGDTAKLTGTTTVKRAAVTRAAFSNTVTRAAVTETNSAGYIAAQSGASKMSSTTSTVSLAADSTTIPEGTSSPTVTVNAATTAAKYVGIKSAALSASGSVTTSGSGSVNPGTNTISKNSNTNVSTGTITTTKPTSGYYVALDAATASGSGSISVSGTGTASASVTTAGYAPTSLTGSGSVSGSGTASVTVNAKSASTTYLPITSGTTSKTDATASASVSKAPTASASATATGFTPSESSTSYYVTASASSASGVATASVSASSASVTAGYTAGVSTSTSAKSATSTEQTASESATIYIPAGSATTPATTKAQSTPSFSRSGNRVTASVAATSVSVTPSVSAGYVASGTAGTITMSASSNYYDIPVQSKTATIGGNTERTVSPDSGYLLSSVTVPANYSPTEYSNYGSSRYNAGYAAAKVGTAGAAQVLSGYTFTNSSSVGATGTMTNRGSWTGSVSPNGSVTIPSGYHNGSGYVSCRAQSSTYTLGGYSSTGLTIDLEANHAYRYINTGVNTYYDYDGYDLSYSGYLVMKTAWNGSGHNTPASYWTVPSGQRVRMIYFTQTAGGRSHGILNAASNYCYHNVDDVHVNLGAPTSANWCTARNSGGWLDAGTTVRLPCSLASTSGVTLSIMVGYYKV